MRRAAIYARYSSEHQTEASIEDQVRNNRRLCEEKGWQVTEVYSDRALSGASTLRPGYQKLLADARRQKFEVVVAEGLDRLSREQVTTALLFQQLSFVGIMIYTRAEGEVSELSLWC
jgi:DNA invertase Pin-like site-specific DNA recombinase